MATNNLLNIAANGQSYTIYENSILTDADATINNTNGLTFTTLNDLEYQNQVNIPYEPLEYSTFSSDSQADSPFIITLTAFYAPTINSYASDGISAALTEAQGQITTCIEQIEGYLQGETFLALLGNPPLYQSYANLKLQSWQYKQNAQMTVLFARLIFQQIRMTNSQSSTGTLQASQLNQASYADTIDYGNINTISSSVINSNLTGTAT